MLNGELTCVRHHAQPFQVVSHSILPMRRHGYYPHFSKERWRHEHQATHRRAQGSATEGLRSKLSRAAAQPDCLYVQHTVGALRGGTGEGREGKGRGGSQKSTQPYLITPPGV